MMIKQDFLDRIDKLPNVFMLASLCQFKYVQGVGEPNNENFKVSMSGGDTIFGKPEQHEAFFDKYITWLETRK